MLMQGWPALTLARLLSKMCCERVARVLLPRARSYLHLFRAYPRQQRRQHENRWRAQSSVPWIGAACPPLCFHRFWKGGVTSLPTAVTHPAPSSADLIGESVIPDTPPLFQD